MAKETDSLVGMWVVGWTCGRMVAWGKAEYVTADGWVGIRAITGRLDEWPAGRVAAMADQG